MRNLPKYSNNQIFPEESSRAVRYGMSISTEKTGKTANSTTEEKRPVTSQKKSLRGFFIRRVFQEVFRLDAEQQCLNTLRDRCRQRKSAEPSAYGISP